MKDVFKELRVLVEKGRKEINKDIFEMVYNNFYKYKQVLISRF